MIRAARSTLDVGGRALSVSNLEKVLFPACGFTKRALIDYYVRIAPALLPHVSDRPLTLVRYPDGVDADGWFQTNCRGEPDWLQVAQMSSREGKTLRYALANEVAALAWMANLASIELHPFLATWREPDRPLVLVFDLDPGAPASLLECARVALDLRERLEAHGLRSFPKTSGGKGLHVYVPLSTATFAQTKAFARALARDLVEREPALVIDRMKKADRAGKVFIDWGQNDPMKSTVAPYSLRAAPVPLVSMPLLWEEVEAARGIRALVFTPRDAFERLEKLGELFQPILQMQQTLP